MRDRTYSSTDVCRIAGLTYRRLDYWTRLGVFDDVARKPGSGSARRYSYADLRLACLLRTVTDAGIDLVAAREAIAAGRFGSFIAEAADVCRTVSAELAISA